VGALSKKNITFHGVRKGVKTSRSLRAKGEKKKRNALPTPPFPRPTRKSAQKKKGERDDTTMKKKRKEKAQAISLTTSKGRLEPSPPEIRAEKNV